MLIYLNQSVKNLGSAGTVCDVKRGYARNYLIPQGIAEVVTLSVVDSIVAQRERDQQKHADLAEKASHLKETLEGKEITLSAATSSQGKLYGSISAQDIVDAIEAQYKVSIPSTAVQTESNLKTVGTHPIILSIGEETIAMSVSIKAEKTK